MNHALQDLLQQHSSQNNLVEQFFKDELKASGITIETYPSLQHFKASNSVGKSVFILAHASTKDGW